MPRGTVTEQPTRPKTKESSLEAYRQQQQERREVRDRIKKRFERGTDQRRSPSDTLSSVRDRPISRDSSRKKPGIFQRMKAGLERAFWSSALDPSKQEEAKANNDLIIRTKTLHTNSLADLAQAKSKLRAAKERGSKTLPQKSQPPNDHDDYLAHLQSNIDYATAWEHRRRRQHNDARKGIDSTNSYLEEIRAEEVERRGGRPLQRPSAWFRPGIQHTAGETGRETYGRIFMRNGYDPDLSPEPMRGGRVSEGPRERRAVESLTPSEEEEEEWQRLTGPKRRTTRRRRRSFRAEEEQ